VSLFGSMSRHTSKEMILQWRVGIRNIWLDAPSPGKFSLHLHMLSSAHVQRHVRMLNYSQVQLQCRKIVSDLGCGFIRCTSKTRMVNTYLPGLHATATTCRIVPRRRRADQGHPFAPQGLEPAERWEPGEHDGGGSVQPTAARGLLFVVPREPARGIGGTPTIGIAPCRESRSGARARISTFPHASDDPARARTATVTRGLQRERCCVAAMKD
jgi:hypothetical protein